MGRMLLYAMAYSFDFPRDTCKKASSNLSMKPLLLVFIMAITDGSVLVQSSGDLIEAKSFNISSFLASVIGFQSQLRSLWRTKNFSKNQYPPAVIAVKVI